MNVPRFIVTSAVLTLSAFICFGQDSSAFKITPTGSASMDVGEVVEGYDKNAGDIEMVQYSRIFLRSGLNVQLTDKTNFSGSMEVKIFNEFPRLVKLGATRRYYYYYYVHQAELVRNLFNDNGLHVDVGGGYFPYKYNPDARNLGEYLFRSTAYPQTLTTEFDFAFARLAGLYAQGDYTFGIHRFDLDVIANLNTEWIAIGDLNLSAIASYNLARIFEVGAGVTVGSLVSADEKTTTPTSSNKTRYFDGTDSSNYYTFRGTKVVGRASIDPKKVLPLDIFGTEDLKIYGEAALLGVKNYGAAIYTPIWYNSILERIPVMVGFNVPTFSLLDVLSLEGEWWGNRYPNSMQGIVEGGVPLPFLEETTEIDSILYKNDNWKWSIFGAKTFARYYRISFQAASDHMRTFAWDWNRQDWEESLRDPKKWYCVVRFGVMF
ncbi:MAG: hypothetical protein JXA71_06470 [Chitinispirillaceae bacterium]|nr:hypothetical protein [Chitinispirillaceae bacterium]